MERLTGRKENGHAYTIGCPDFEIPKIVGMIVQNVVDKCADIEDILGDEYDLDRLRELVEADREGRCSIAPKLICMDEVTTLTPEQCRWMLERFTKGDPHEDPM